MKFGRSLQQKEESIQMAPLIDIVFLTLVFFMVTSVYATLESQVDIKLPTASTAVDVQRTRGEIYINLRSNGTIVLNDREMSLDELQEVLYRVAEYFPGGAVIIRGDRDAYLGTTVAILNACRKADIQNISIAALKEEPKGAQ